MRMPRRSCSLGVRWAGRVCPTARSVLQRAHALITPETDPHHELLYQEAAMWAQMDSLERAIDLLKQFKAGRPDANFAHHWWWAKVRSHPRYRELVEP